MSYCVTTPVFFWKIEDFSTISKEVSPILITAGLKWQVKYSSFKEDDIQKVVISLACLSTSEMSSFTDFKAAFGFPNEDVNCVLLKMSNYKLNDKEWCIWTDGIASLYKLCGQIKDLTIFIRITPSTLSSLFKSGKNAEEVYSELLDVSSLIGDLQKLFNNDVHHDFVLKCGERSFPVHKSILSARSEFFAGMFRCDMKEAKEGSGNIEDVDPDIFELVLRYIYTGKIPQLPKKSLQKVCAAADRFGVKSLKIKCYSLLIDKFVKSPDEDSVKGTEEDTLKENESMEVVQAESKIAKVNQFLKDLFMTQEWRAFSQALPQEALEMCRPYILK